MARAFVIGDPQAPFAKVLEVLDRHQLLAGDRLAPEVTLVSIGDHFDYDLTDPWAAGLEGLKLLRWLASHPPAQVRIVLGNHDIARVMELAGFDDAGFATARVLAREVESGARTVAEFRAVYPALPAPGVIGRDYASFRADQRALVVELLLSGRFELAVVGALANRGTVLLTHAAVTERELALLGITGARDAYVIAAALRARLATAIAAVRADWERGVMTPLDLQPIHVAGHAGTEGGGLLYHRPSNPDASSSAALFDPVRPRRFDPRTLPRGLTQIAGHSGHAKCVHELGDWVTPTARTRKHGGVRSLIVDGEQVTYDLVAASSPLPAPAALDAAELVLIDGELRRVPSADVDLVPLAAVA